MIPAFAVMIGMYIITRTLDLLLQRARELPDVPLVLQILAAATIVAAVASIGIILYLGWQVDQALAPLQQLLGPQVWR